MTSGSGNGWPGVIKVPVEKVDHDPLCKQRFDPHQPPCPECEILATGRADERRRGSVIRAALMQSELDRMDLREKVEEHRLAWFKVRGLEAQGRRAAYDDVLDMIGE